MICTLGKIEMQEYFNWIKNFASLSNSRNLCSITSPKAAEKPGPSLYARFTELLLLNLCCLFTKNVLPTTGHDFYIIIDVFHRRLRRSLPSKILIQLCLSLMLTLICFVVGADMTTPVFACRGFAILIQYFLLVCFCWMIVEGVNLYLSFVIVMGSYIQRFMVKASLFAWGK